MADENGEMSGQTPRIVGDARDVSELLKEPALDPACKRVIVGIPLKGHTPPASYHDRMMMFQHLGDRTAADYYEKKNPRYTFTLACVGEILVPYARERICQAAIEMNAEYVMMIDDDMLCPKDLFFKLVAHDKDIVAALAFTRNPDHKPVIYDVIEGYDPVSRQNYYVNKYALNYPRNALVECDAVGFGAVLIKRKVIEAVKEPRFMGLMGCGEDITFCYKAKKLGFGVWMDTSIKLGHLGAPIVITEEYADKHLGLTPEEREKQYGRYTKYASMEITA